MEAGTKDVIDELSTKKDPMGKLGKSEVLGDFQFLSIHNEHEVRAQSPVRFDTLSILDSERRSLIEATQQRMSTLQSG
jgi:hypothetical protein